MIDYPECVFIQSVPLGGAKVMFTLIEPWGGDTRSKLRKLL